jgi:hypothetical protein
MPRDVRIQIKDDESMLAAMEDEVALIVLTLAPDAAKNTLSRL